MDLEGQVGGGGEDRSVGKAGRDQTQWFSVLGGDGGATEGEGEWTGPGGEGCAWERTCREHGLEANTAEQV